MSDEECEHADSDEVVSLLSDFRRDFEETALVLLGRIRSISNPCALLSNIVALVEDLPDGGDANRGSGPETDADLDDDDDFQKVRQRVATVVVPRVTEILLARSFLAEGSALEVNNFIKRSLEIAARNLLRANNPEVILPSIVAALDTHSPFYLYHSSEEADGAEDLQCSQFVRVTNGTGVSHFFVENLEFWGATGGFKAFIGMICRKEVSVVSSEIDGGSILFSEVQQVLRAIYTVKNHIQPEFLAKYVLELTEAVAHWVESSSCSELTAVSRDLLLEVVHVLELLLTQSQERVPVGDHPKDVLAFEQETFVPVAFVQQKLHELRLEMLFAFFCSSSLEKRIFGFSEIIGLVTRLYNEQVQEQDQPTADSLSQALSFLIDWIDRRQLVAKLFGETIHTELVKRSTPLFQFASELEYLPPEWIDLVWRSYHGNCTDDQGDITRSIKQHAALRSVTHTLLLDLVEFVDLEILELLLSYLQRVRVRDFDEAQLMLFSSMARRNMQTVEGTSVFPLLESVIFHLWEVILPQATNSNVVEQVILQIADILAHVFAESSMDNEGIDPSSLAAGRLLSRAVEKIMDLEDTSVSLQLVTQLAQLIQERRISIMIGDNDQVSVVNTVLGELVAFKHKIVSHLEVNSPSFSSLSGSEHNPSPVLPGYLENVKIRLHALKGACILDHFLGIAVKPFDQAHAETLWSILVSEAIMVDEASLYFQWIMFCTKPVSSSSAGSLELISNEVASSLIIDKFSSLSPHLMTLPALACFQALFSRVNLSKGSLQTFVTEPAKDENVSASELAESTTIVVDLVVSIDELAALDVLWYITLHATDSKVAEDCFTLLVGCYLDVVPTLRDPLSMLQIKRKFILRCMNQLMSLKSDLSQQNDVNCLHSSRRVDRCLDLLRYFLETSKDFHSDNKSYEDDSVTHSVDNNGGSSNHLDSLEERLPFLSVYPSPMKDGGADFTDRTVFGTSRRPSWTFQHQHFPMLEAIPDDGDRRDGERLAFSEVALGQGCLPLDICVAESETVSGVRSPTLRHKPSLSSTSSPSPQRGPSLSIEEIDSALVGEFTGISSSDTSGDPQGIPDLSLRRSKYCAINHVLANEGEHFTQLFELVDIGDSSIASRAWEILCLLPTNNNLLQRMIRLRSASGAQDVEWEDLLSSSSLHRLLYSLRLVEALLIPYDTNVEPAAFSTDMARRQWRERFVRLGGAHHLYSMFIHKQVGPAGNEVLSSEVSGDLYSKNLKATCLGGVMRCLGYFLELALAPTTPHTEPKFDTRLLHVTLPKYLESVDFFVMFQRAAHIATETCLVRAQDMSNELEEAATVACKLCCSLIRSSPEMILWDGKEHDVVESKPGVIRNLMQTLFVDCAHARLREKALSLLEDLSKCARESANSSSLRSFMAMMTAGFCSLVVEVTSSTESSHVLELDQLTRVSCQLVSHWANSCGSELGVVLDGILNNVYRETMSPRFKTKSVQGTSPLLCLLKVLTEITEKSNLCRMIALRWVPSEPVASSHRNWIQDILIDQLVFPESALCQSSIIFLSDSERETAQQLVVRLLCSPTGDSRTNDKLLLSNVEYLLLRQRQFLSIVNEELKGLGRPWNYTPVNSLKTESDCAGLTNPGCVCYMNSLLQQLFMMPGFFSGLLQLDCSGQSSSSQLEWLDEVKELQKLFVSLSYTKKRACDPTQFALSHRDLDGNPTDLHTQMDADEFFCMLLDRLETFIESKSRSEDVDKNEYSDKTDTTGTISRHFLDECFGGILVNQILTEHGHLSEREERFFALSLEITKKHTLTDSLALYVQGEPLDGENAYFCEREQRKVSATKRICIKKAPKTLVCHLKRFNFDFDTMEKVKINDYLEFPTEIDISPYTAGGVGSTAVAPNIYDLVGVVVHSGTSEAGHYYSFIKDRKGSNTNKWFEFNDEIVRAFDEESMAEECFGGEEVRQRWDPSQAAFVPVMEMKRRSAYMLIYEQRSADQGDGSTSTALGSLFTTNNLSPYISSIIEASRSENKSIESVVRAFGGEYEQFLLTTVRFASSAKAGISDKLVRVSYQCGCEYLFGIHTLRPLTNASITLVDNSEMINSSAAFADSVTNWLSILPATEDSDCERMMFCSWFIDAATAFLINDSTTEHTRTWLFDALILTDTGSETTASCIRIVTGVLAFVMKSLALSEEMEPMLARTVKLVASVLDILFARHSRILVQDPINNGAVTVSASKIRRAVIGIADMLHEIIHTLPDAVKTEEEKSKIQQALVLVFVTQADVISRFFAALEIMVDLAVLVPQRRLSLSSLSSGKYGQYPADELSQLYLCTLSVERMAILKLLEYRKQFEAVSDNALALDLDTLYRGAVVKGLILAGCRDLLEIFIQEIICSGTENECDRIIVPLLTALEDFRGTPNASDAFDVIDVVIENCRTKDPIRERFVLESVFSPSRGVLEAAIYYKERVDEKTHTLALLRLLIRHVARSTILQQLIVENQVWFSRVQWIVEWVASTVDPTSEIRRDRSFDTSNASLNNYLEPMCRDTVVALFMAIESGFKTTVFTRSPTARSIEPQLNDSEEEDVGTAPKYTEESMDENQAELADTSIDNSKRLVTHEQPEDEENDSNDRISVGDNRDISTFSFRATPPMRLRLDLDAAFVNNSEA